MNTSPLGRACHRELHAEHALKTSRKLPKRRTESRSAAYMRLLRTLLSIDNLFVFLLTNSRAAPNINVKFYREGSAWRTKNITNFYAAWP